MTHTQRRDRLLFDGLVLLGVIVMATSGPSGSASAETIEEGQFELQALERNASAWVSVEPGQEVRWETESSAFIWLYAEVATVGEVDGDDGWSEEGCARSDEHFKLRLRWENSAFPQSGLSQISYRIDLENDTGDCATIDELRADYVRNHTFPLGFPGPMGGAGLTVAGLVVAVLILKLFSTRRGRAP